MRMAMNPRVSFIHTDLICAFRPSCMYLCISAPPPYANQTHKQAKSYFTRQHRDLCIPDASDEQPTQSKKTVADNEMIHSSTSTARTLSCGCPHPTTLRMSSPAPRALTLPSSPSLQRLEASSCSLQVMKKGHTQDIQVFLCECVDSRTKFAQACTDQRLLDVPYRRGFVLHNEHLSSFCVDSSYAEHGHIPIPYIFPWNFVMCTHVF
jgi:hypothetical protein